jgi:hypothetical protein
VTPGSGYANYPFGEISKKHRNTLVGTLRKIDGSTFATGNNQAERRALEHLNETSLSQLIHGHGNHKLDHRIRQASPD